MSIQAIKCSVTVAAICIFTSCTSLRGPNSHGVYHTGGKSTYEHVLAQAVAGAADFQNQLGFMLVFGEQVDIDILEAHYWFHLAAKAGNVQGQKNDAYLHALLDLPSESVPSTYEVGNKNKDSQVRELSAKVERAIKITVDISPERLARGEKNYLAYCGGCHGFNGISTYASFPSFARNQRMEKSDQELFQNVSSGAGGCPSWGNTLPDQDIRDMITFVRTLSRAYEMGISHTIRKAPEQYFLFGAMSTDIGLRGY